MVIEKNKRRKERVSTILPVRLGTTSGLTNDVSASGICFEVDASYQTKSEVSFVIELDAPADKMLLNCKGRIVRIEEHGCKKSVAVELNDLVLRAAD